MPLQLRTSQMLQPVQHMQMVIYTMAHGTTLKRMALVSTRQSMELHMKVLLRMLFWMDKENSSTWMT